MLYMRKLSLVNRKRDHESLINQSINHLLDLTLSLTTDLRLTVSVNRLRRLVLNYPLTHIPNNHAWRQ